MTRIHIDSFINNTSLNNYKIKNDLNKEVLWTEYLISLINNVISIKVDTYYQNMADALLGVLNSRNMVLNANNNVEKTFEKNIKNKENHNNKLNEKEFIEKEIRSISGKISNIDNISNSNELFKQLKQLYKALEKIDKFVIEGEKNLSISNKKYIDSENNFIIFQKLYINQLSFLLNEIKKVQNLNINEKSLMYKDSQKQDFEKLIEQLPLDNERKSMFKSLVDEYIESKIQTIKYLNELALEIVSDPNIISTGAIINNESYKKVLLGEAIEDAFYIGNGGINVVCSDEINNDDSAKKRINDTILSMSVANKVLINEDVDIDEVNELYTDATDPMIYTILSSIKDIDVKKENKSL